MNHIFSNIIYPVFIVLLFTLNLYSQETDKTTNLNATETEIISEKTVAVEKKIRPVKKIIKNDLFLFVDSNDYKFLRIEGISPKEEIDNTQFEKTEIKNIPENTDHYDLKNISKKNDKKEVKGFLGFSKDNTDLITRGVLIFLLILIFVLYKLKSGTSNRNVLRNYPKK